MATLIKPTTIEETSSHGCLGTVPLLPTLLSIALAAPALGQTYTSTTVAGGALPEEVPGVYAGLGAVSAVAVDQAGNVFLSLPGNHVVLKLDAQTGILSRVAGNGTAGCSGDQGPAGSAQLQNPSGLALGSDGSLYIADTNNFRIRKVTGGVITTAAGPGGSPIMKLIINGVNQFLYWPFGVAVDAKRDIYFADPVNNIIRKVSNGSPSTAAGNWTKGFSGDEGPAASAQLFSPWSVAVDHDGNLYIADTGNQRIRKVSNGSITTVAGDGTQGFGGDGGPAVSARLSAPTGVAVDAVGNIFIADSGNNRVRKISGGVITTIAGDGNLGFGGDDGPAAAARLSKPQAVAVDSAGTVYVVDSGNYRVRRILDGMITTVAGNGTWGWAGDGAPAAGVQLASPSGVAADPSGNVYLAEPSNHRILQVANGSVATFAGAGTPGFSGDNGSAVGAELRNPQGIASDSSGNLYIADTDNNRIRLVSNGVITTLAGTGAAGFSGDNGEALYAELSGPLGVAVDLAGTLYIADTGNNRIRAVTNGIITTVAGSGARGFSGDEGLAVEARLSAPSGVAVGSEGVLYIADTGNNRVRAVAGGVITTVAGGGYFHWDGSAGDGEAATSAELQSPRGVAVDSAGNLYIADTNQNRIRRVSGGWISTIAAGRDQTFGTDGPVTSAQVAFPGGVAVDSAANIYLADTGNNRIRILVPTPYTYSLTPDSSPLVGAGGGTGKFFVSAFPFDVAWTAMSTEPWLTITDGASGIANGTVSYAIAPNASSQPRRGAITIGDTAFFIIQAGTANSICGRVTLAGASLPGITMTLNIYRSTTSTTTTDSVGFYSFNNLSDRGEFLVTPSHPDYTFSPGSSGFSNLYGSHMANFNAAVRQ